MKRFKNILVICDEQSAYEHAFDRVAWLAKANGATVTLMDVVDAAPGELSRLFSALPGGRSKELEARVLDVHRERLEELADPLRRDGLSVQTLVAQGTAFLMVIRRVLAAGHDLVIKGAQRGGDRPFFRGADMHLIRKCPCPVWVLNSRMEPRAARILAPVDPDPQDRVRDGLNRTILELATSLAEQDDAQIDVISVWGLHEEMTLRNSRVAIPEEEIQAILAREESQSAERFDQLMSAFTAFDARIRRLHIKGTAADVIPAYVEAEGIDTVVMGTVGRTGIAGVFIGNTAETILSRVACSVLTVKPEGFASPVTLDGAAP